ncbi:MAG: DinB family protein [Candidatus Sulfopaludibacter sp.]|nr:DinB family protein [Candidatus Sulfopaludibacter sp.]
MIKQIEPMMAEFQQEAATTKRVLQRIPADKLEWRPHPHSMSIGQLSIHIASIPGDLARLAQVDAFDVSTVNFNPPQPGNMEAILTTLDESVAAAEAYMDRMSESEAMANWSLNAGAKNIFTMPRVVLLRTIMLNHWYHHRGQLSVYLRLLEVPVPSIYGPSYDENPFLSGVEIGAPA